MSRPCTSRLRRSYSRFISRTSFPPLRNASHAATCAIVGAHMIAYWWILVIASMTPRGPAA